ncbi:nucleoporin nup189 [Ephemerocybe angulata]|uniref:Nucleoporin nup189 n=1 Tax=Ephemerocybe angulata TaxID=980116 RepID=A0A8H6IF45_9AGAR|nr:nucleoporin nup189 [Tulosesus angulatus]
MVRFRAFDSGSSSESDDEQDTRSVASDEPLPRHRQEQPTFEPEGGKEEEEGSDDSDDSAMLEDELMYGVRAKARPRTALYQDENGDFQVAREEDDDDIQDGSESPSSRLSPTEPSGPRQNIIPWARHVGVDAQKMHVMQTSLFRMPEEAAALKALNNQPPSRPKTISTLPPPTRLSRKHSRDSDGDGLKSDGSRDRASFAQDIEPAVLRPTRKYARVEISSSIANGLEGAYVDAGLAYGRSFRVGWGPGGTLVHSGSICTPYASSVTSSNSSVITLTKTPFPAEPPPPPEFDDSQEIPEDASPVAISLKLLQHHLTHTPITKSDSGVPLANPSSSSAPTVTSPTPLDFASFASLFPTTHATGPAPLFRLGSALFDPIDLRLNSGRKQASAIGVTSITPDLRNRVALLRRRHALSEWLEHVVKSSVEGDIRMKSTGPISGNYTAADTVFTSLTGHQVEEACTLAMDTGYLKLATLVSQAGGDKVFKSDIRAQLEIWKDEKLAPTPGGGGLGVGVYRLLSGPDDQSDENLLASWVEEVCAGLDWKRVFGLCLWYGLGVDAAVVDVLRLYEGLTKRYNSSLVARPLPNWQSKKGRVVQQQQLSLVPSSRAGHRQPEDPQYSLIRLHADPALSLSQVLEPQSFGPDLRYGGDFADRAPTYTAATRGAVGRASSDDELEGAGSTIDVPSSELGHSHTANLLTSAYAFELEGWGQIQEAAFVLLHLEDPEGRKKAIKDLLARAAPHLDEFVTKGLVASLKIPITWVHEAKAMYALDQGDVWEAYQLYLSAQLWNAAHDLAVLELAPDAVLRKDTLLLQDLFEPFDLDGRRDKIDGWFVRGKTFVDYVNILDRLPILQEKLITERETHVVVQPPAGELSTTEEIDDLTRRIPKLIALLPDVLHRPRSVDDRHAAAIEEMTQSLLSVMGKAKPAMLLKQPLLNFMDPSTKLTLIRGKNYARFLQRVGA